MGLMECTSRCSAAAPCLAVSLKVDISIVREFLSREEFDMSDPIATRPDSLGMGSRFRLALVVFTIKRNLSRQRRDSE
jgi:hypothetical protein